MTKKNIRYYRAWGFDETKRASTGRYIVKCSACAVSAINGVHTHEGGCPNMKRRCRGCDNIIPHNQIYCKDCL